jgi:hypothetical protein
LQQVRVALKVEPKQRIIAHRNHLMRDSVFIRILRAKDPGVAAGEEAPAPRACNVLGPHRVRSVFEAAKLVAAVKLVPSKTQAGAFAATGARRREAVTWLAAIGFGARALRQCDLHKMPYKELRNRFGLSAQMAVRSIAKVVDAFKSDRRLAPIFRMDAAQPYDEPILRFIKDGAAASISIESRFIVRMLHLPKQSETGDVIRIAPCGRCRWRYSA